MNELIQYVRKGEPKHNRRKRPVVGVVIAAKNDSGVVSIGWSRCRKGDSFDKEKGLDIARVRAKECSTASYNAPYDVKKVVKGMIIRATEYFKLVPYNP